MLNKRPIRGEHHPVYYIGYITAPGRVVGWHGEGKGDNPR